MRVALMELVALTLAIASGCGPADARRQRLGAANPLDRAEAVVRVSEASDPEAVHKLVDLLDDPDAAVRMYAIQGLRRLFGDDLGYVHYASPGARHAALQRWREALRSGQLTLRPERTSEVPAVSGAAPAEPPGAGGEADTAAADPGASR